MKPYLLLLLLLNVAQLFALTQQPNINSFSKIGVNIPFAAYDIDDKLHDQYSEVKIGNIEFNAKDSKVIKINSAHKTYNLHNVFIDSIYAIAKNNLIAMLNGIDTTNLQKAIYVVENAWYGNKLNKDVFDSAITSYANFCNAIAMSNFIQYIGRDSVAVKRQGSVLSFITDSIPIMSDNKIIWVKAFEDNKGLEKYNWDDTFVSSLIEKRTGNNDSKAKLYRLIMDHLHEKCWFAISPKKIYIKAKTGQRGWYNIDFQSNDFPTDAFIVSNGFIHMDAIRNGIYMDTLSLKQSISLCLFELAENYFKSNGTKNDFTMSCCDEVLFYYPNLIKALLLKVELLSHKYVSSQTLEEKSQYLETLTSLCAKIHSLGYRERDQNKK